MAVLCPFPPRKLPFENRSNRFSFLERGLNALPFFPQ